MEQKVSIILKNGDQYTVTLSAADTAAFDKSSARSLIGDLFEEAGLETPNPVGKILLVDQILMLAEEFRAPDYAASSEKVRKFLAAALIAMGRPSLTIDLVAYKL